MVDELKLRQDITILINALGLNNTLTHIDIRSVLCNAVVFSQPYHHFCGCIAFSAAIVISNSNIISILPCGQSLIL